MYRRLPSLSDMAALGLKPKHFDAEAPVEVWPDVWPVVMVFGDLDTQWRIGPAGATGLDYAALPMVLDLHEIQPSKRRAMFDDIRVMESAALAEIHKDAKQ